MYSNSGPWAAATTEIAVWIGGCTRAHGAWWGQEVSQDGKSAGQPGSRSQSVCVAARALQSTDSCPVGHLPLWLRLLEQRVAAAPWQLGRGVSRSRGALAPGHKEAGPSVVAATSQSCLWPAKDEPRKKIIVMLIICTKVMRSHLVLVPPPCCSVAGGYK